MKNKTRVIIIVLLVFILSIQVFSFIKKIDRKDYVCTFTYYEDGRTGDLIVDKYVIRENSTTIEVYKTNGDIWLIDSTEIRMLCVELED